MNSRMKVTQHRAAHSSRSSATSSKPLLTAQKPLAVTPQLVAQARFGHSFARLVSASTSQSPGETVQRQGVDEEEELQIKADPTAQHQETSGGTPNNTGLPDNLKSGIEALAGISLDNVRVNYNSSQPAQLNALAYAQGTDIHVAPGQEQHLPHEAWHVVQQTQGRVKPTMQMKGGVSVNDDARLEHEADVMGARALHHAPTAGNSVQRHGDRAWHPNGAVAQLATNLRFDANVTGNSQITATQHNRGAVHATAWQWVLNNGAWSTVPANSVCNHSLGYDGMAQKILNAIHDEDLADAALAINQTYEDLESKNMGIGTPTSTHKQRIDDVIAHPGNVVNVDNMIDTFNYYIYKICDYPRNLFYWPATTGAAIDKPSGAAPHNPAHYWAASDTTISNQQRLNRENQRLTAGRVDLRNALP